jgi:hypothetical protein
MIEDYYVRDTDPRGDKYNHLKHKMVVPTSLEDDIDAEKGADKKETDKKEIDEKEIDEDEPDEDQWTNKKNPQPSENLSRPVSSSIRLAAGKVYIGSKNMRGKWAPKPNEKIKTVDVTSVNVKYRGDFSPMTAIQGGYKGYYNFEAYWQSGKIYEGIPEIVTKRWWKNVKEPKRRYPAPKGTRVLYAKWVNNPEKMDYVTSRKKVYVPEYFDLMKNTKSATELKKWVEAGNDIIIYDFDGPRTHIGDVTTIEITVDSLREKINDPTFPFGHGYVVAAWLKNIPPKEYI